ncbi:YncE family protein [Prolixibacter denitrificans]|uniref:YVTN family beta-propeller protein n=1 Tax=Prolixibacter denitrificans TaxID=1541063 RepID=A0A2P8CDU2_9BACT|nr:YncE family protein [Prolixibacter denitrificans]PSK83092.1 YVTN family beta-propeller protein [Prolixibacter denitrificans]GET22024.1 hypothetical protein JCM18694_22700 [Prolixibacter denitrificans]
MRRLFLIMFLFAGISAYAQPAGQYRIVKRIHVPGNSFWDYLTADSQGHLYVSHGNMVQVIDPKNSNVLGTIENLDGVHGIALAENLNKGFISSGRDSMVAIFDLKTLKVIKKVKVTGANPDAILYDPFSNKVFTFNGGSSSSTVIDAATDKVVATIPLPGKPEFSVTDKKGKVYVNIEDKSMIACIDAKDLKLKKSWSIAPGEEPSGLAADFATGKLFSVCHNHIMTVFDLKTEKVAETLPIGSGPDGAAFDEGLHRAYSSNGDGTLTVVAEDGNHFKVLETVPTQRGARTMCVDQKNHHIFLPTAEFYPLAKGERWPKMKPGTFTILEVSPR